MQYPALFASERYRRKHINKHKHKIIKAIIINNKKKNNYMPANILINLIIINQIIKKKKDNKNGLATNNRQLISIMNNFKIKYNKESKISLII